MPVSSVFSFLSESFNKVRTQTTFQGLFIYKHGSHKATCSLRYDRQGQTRTTPGLAARQLNSSGLLCSRHVLSDMLSDGAKILSRDVVQVSLQGKPALKTKTFRGINFIIFDSVGACLFVEGNRQVASRKSCSKGKHGCLYPMTM